MTRYKELRRMEAALAHKNKSELEWAEGWARDRIRFAARKDHLKTWNKRLAKIQAALAELSD